MLSSYLFVLAALAAMVTVVAGALAALRPASGRLLSSRIEEITAGFSTSKYGDVATQAHRAAYVGLCGLLNAAALDLERSRLLAPIAALVVGLLFPVAALTNAVLGGSPRLLIWYLAAILAVVAIAVADTLTRPRRWTAVVAGAVAIAWAGVLPLYALWSLTSHFIGGPLYRSVAAGMILGVLLYAVLATMFTLLRRSNHAVAENSGATWLASLTVGLPIYYVGYWLALALMASETGVEPARNWTDLLACTVAGGLSFAAVVPMFRSAGERPSNLRALAVLAGSGLCALTAGLVIVTTGRGSGTAEWLGAMPLLPWLLLPLTLMGFTILKSLHGIVPTRAWTASRPFSAIAISAGTVAAVTAALAAALA